MGSTRTVLILLTVAAVAGTIGLLVLAMLQQAEISCEVCITFEGRTNCANAAGPDEASASRTAVDTACAMISSGMTQSIACSNTPPDSLICQ